MTRRRDLGCVDLFAGAGGFSLAAKQAGLKVNLAIENNGHACATYRHNLCSDLSDTPKLLEADITSVCAVSIASELRAAGQRCDILLGGPPCQGFSTHRINGAGIDDPRNSLIDTYFNFVSALQPAVFLMENVPGMLWKRHEKYLKAFYKRGNKENYHLFTPVVIDARDFGLPQRRKRVFILGVRDDVEQGTLVWPPKQTHCDPKKLSENYGLRPWVNCGHIFEPSHSNDPNDKHMNHSKELVEVFKSTPVNGGSRRDSSRQLECHKNHNGHKDVYGRINPAEPAPTMTTACINPSKGRFVHPTLHHGITMRQAARIQTFPDSFVFQGGLIAGGQQIGNAVPVALGEILIRHIAPIAQEAMAKARTRKSA